MKLCRLLWIVFLGVVFSGCTLPQDSPPKIVSNAPEFEPLPERAEPPVVSRPRTTRRAAYPAEWYPPSNVEHRWEGIVIHHSATSYGNVEIIDRWHREGNHWEGVGYNFVIGNGTDSLDGEVEVTFRWQRQMVGAHCKTPGNWANLWTVGICLIGDFSHAPPTQAQMASLRRLVAFLQERYRIPDDKVYTHQDTPGARVTDCPGHFFNVHGVL